MIVYKEIVQIGDHSAKSEMLIQSETALNVGENRIIRWLNWKQYNKGNTKMHGTFGYQNKFKTKTSVSRKK